MVFECFVLADGHWWRTHDGANPQPRQSLSSPQPRQSLSYEMRGGHSRTIKTLELFLGLIRWKDGDFQR